MFTRIEPSGEDMCLRLYGPLDAGGARALQAAADSVPWRPCGDLLLDMAGVELIDEDGLAALLFLCRRLSARRQGVRLIGVRGSWLARLRELGLAEQEMATVGVGRALRGRGRDHAAGRRPMRGPDGE